MNFKVFRTEMFKEELEKQPRIEQERIKRFERHLSDNPFAGKPLGLVFFREKKLNGRRVYYLVYEEFIVVLMVGISNKKNQQAKIDYIKTRLPEYYGIIKESITKLS